MLKKALFAFGLNPYGATLPIQLLLKFLASLPANSRQHRNHHVSSNVSNHCASFLIEQHPCERFEVLETQYMPFSLKKRMKSTLSANADYLARIRHFQTHKIIWYRNEIPDVSRPFVVSICKLGSCRLGLVTIHQNVLLKTALEK